MLRALTRRSLRHSLEEVKVLGTISRPSLCKCHSETKENEDEKRSVEGSMWPTAYLAVGQYVLPLNA